MKTVRILYHMARADFLERTRSYSFLVMLGLVMWLGYLSASGQFRMRVPPDYIGIVNSAWVGGTMTVTISFLLGWLGFYLVKGSVNRDYTTGVGQIMATTPLSRPLYMLGKWLSNFAILGIMVLILMIAGIGMNLLLGSGGFDLLALITPLALIGLPCVALVAAFAVLFEAVSWLRGGLGNVVYFFVFLSALVVSGEVSSLGTPGHTINPYIDFSGWQIIGDSVSHAAKAAFPESSGGFTFSITDLDAPHLFTWQGVSWTGEILLSRLFFLGVTLGIVMFAALLFDRFNPMQLLRAKQVTTSPPPAAEATRPANPVDNVRLTPLSRPRNHFRFDALFVAELKLFLKGQPWWWYVIAAGLVIAQVSSPLETTRILLIVAWVWPILILGELGCRENRFDTRQLVFSAARPLRNQLPAAWLSAFLVMVLLGCGALLHFILAGETSSILGWLTGAIFIPSLALALGVLTGSSKAFEVLYVLWMYLLTQKVPSLDFAGISPESDYFRFVPLAIALLITAALARQQQLKTH